ncbi:MAG TPA: hypothetical protein VLJ88_13810 [Propionibacteriaceae bacterium]|nr:hypothetical protein [Propionibacteriaceae bacterium]
MYAASTLGVLDALATRPQTAADVADAVGVAEDLLRRILPGLVIDEASVERADGKFELAAVGLALARLPGPLQVRGGSERTFRARIAETRPRGGSGRTFRARIAETRPRGGSGRTFRARIAQRSGDARKVAPPLGPKRPAYAQLAATDGLIGTIFRARHLARPARRPVFTD